MRVIDRPVGLQDRRFEAARNVGVVQRVGRPRECVDAVPRLRQLGALQREPAPRRDEDAVPRARRPVAGEARGRLRRAFDDELAFNANLDVSGRSENGARSNASPGTRRYDQVRI